jgi:hypothetical protein
MRGRAVRRCTAAVVLTVAVSAMAAATALANESPHIKIAAPRTSARARTITFSGATTAQFPNLRAYWERGKASCAPTFADKPRLAQEWGWNDIAPEHSAGLVSFEHRETVHSGDTGELHVLCAYLVNHTGRVGARAQLSYRDPALR